MRKPKYAQDGVDVPEGDRFSKFCGDLCRTTYGNTPHVKIRDFANGHFRGPRGWQFRDLPEGYWIDVAPDGIGTKVVLIDASFGFDNAARDWVAMCCGDVTRWGGLPLMVVNVLDVATLGKYPNKTNMAFRKMMRGLKKVCDEASLVMYKGETAELCACVGSENPDALTKFNWCGMAIGAYHPDLMITGEKLYPGYAVVALREYGFRSNGISSVRKALAMKFGREWWQNPRAVPAIKRASAPSVLYDRLLSAANGWFFSNPQPRPHIPLSLVCHITGGGIRSKFFEDILIPLGLSADLPNLWDPPRIMKECAAWRGMRDPECYDIWNGGQGALVCMHKSFLREFFQLASSFGIEAKLAGKIVRRRSPSMKIISKFTGKEFTCRPK